MKSNGTLKAAVRQGLIPSSVINHTSIYEYYLKIKGSYDKKSVIVTAVSEDKKVCESLVYRVLKDFGC